MKNLPSLGLNCDCFVPLVPLTRAEVPLGRQFDVVTAPLGWPCTSKRKKAEKFEQKYTYTQNLPKKFLFEKSTLLGTIWNKNPAKIKN